MTEEEGAVACEECDFNGEPPLWCTVCYTEDPTTCVNCGYCTSCERIQRKMAFKGWRSREPK